MNRQQVIITFAKINRMIKSLNYITSLESRAVTEDALPIELDQLSVWANSVQRYWNKNQSKILAGEVFAIGSSESVRWILNNLDLSGGLQDVLSNYLETMDALKADVSNWEKKSKGEYWMLPENLANDKATKLLTRATNGGFLDHNYQPKENTQLVHLKLIAWATAKILKLPHRAFWAPFSKLWGIENLKAVYVPRVTRKDIVSLSELYPEVDLSQAPNRRKAL